MWVLFMFYLFFCSAVYDFYLVLWFGVCVAFYLPHIRTLVGFYLGLICLFGFSFFGFWGCYFGFYFVFVWVLVGLFGFYVGSCFGFCLGVVWILCGFCLGLRWVLCGFYSGFMRV